MPNLKLRLTLSKSVDLDVKDDDLLASLQEKLADHGVDSGDDATQEDLEAAIRDLWEEDPTGLLEIDPQQDLVVEVLSGSFEMPEDSKE